MSICQWFTPESPNPDLLGRFLLKSDEIDPEKREAHEQKLRRARDYIASKDIKIRPLCKQLEGR